MRFKTLLYATLMFTAITLSAGAHAFWSPWDSGGWGNNSGWGGNNWTPWGGGNNWSPWGGGNNWSPWGGNNRRYYGSRRYGGNNYTPWGGSNNYAPWGGSNRRYYGSRRSGGNNFMPWGGGNNWTPWGGSNRRYGRRDSTPWNNTPWGRMSGPWDSGPWNDDWRRSTRWGKGNNTPWGDPSDWFDPEDPRGGMSAWFDDMLDGPHEFGEMPGGWTAPSISVPNPVEVGDEFEGTSRLAPKEAAEQMNNFEMN